MKVAFVASEAFPYAKTGGLADVAGSLPKALEKLGVEVKIFIPKYSTIDEDKYGLKYCWDVGEIPVRVAGVPRSVHLHQAVLPGSNVEVNFIDCTYYFHRGLIYTTDFDEDQRFILLSKAVIEVLQKLQWKPDIIHCNDWQTGLLPLLLNDNYSWDKFFNNTATLFTIHNIGYQGRFPKAALFHAEIDGKYFYPGGPVEFEDSVSFMKAGIVFSDLLNTVSYTYAKEILLPEHGAGLDVTLKSRESDLFGILNGVDYSSWNPETDTHLPYNYSVNDLSGKLKNKKFLLKNFGLPFSKDIPLIGIISRMVSQKGFDIFADAAADLINLDVQWMILGNGEEKFENLFRTLSAAFPDKFACYIGYNNELSHLIEAASDMFLMPSLYEPCGLNQIYSLKYGTVPIVRKTGGLADTVQDWHEYKYGKGEETGTGFTFELYSAAALTEAVARGTDTFKFKDTWKIIQQNGMKKDFSWNKSAEEYFELYEKAVSRKKEKE
jgi:starch synthase